VLGTYLCDLCVHVFRWPANEAVRVMEVAIWNDYAVCKVVGRGVLLFFKKRKFAGFLLHTLSITDARMACESFLF